MIGNWEVSVLRRMKTPRRTRRNAPRNTYVTVRSGRLAMPWWGGSERTGMVEIIRRVREKSNGRG